MNSAAPTPLSHTSATTKPIVCGAEHEGVVEVARDFARRQEPRRQLIAVRRRQRLRQEAFLDLPADLQVALELQQLLLALEQQLVVEHDRRLRGERLDDELLVRIERAHLCRWPDRAR